MVWSLGKVLEGDSGTLVLPVLPCFQAAMWRASESAVYSCHDGLTALTQATKQCGQLATEGNV